MRTHNLMIPMLFTAVLIGCDNGPPQKNYDQAARPQEGVQMPPLNDFEKHVIVDKGTERAFSGKFWDHYEKGTYSCRQCGADLYESDSKFKSDCGWPSFDDEIPGAVSRQTDADGMRTEITCAACGGHLGHVFLGEQLTDKNTRHCVNSASLVFRPLAARAYFAGGCFWGMEHHFRSLPGVISTTVGYTGGSAEGPTYRDVSSGKTGHAEAVEVAFDPNKITFEKLAREFFIIHDPTTLNRQGNDIGTQYRSAVFYVDDDQRKIVENLIAELQSNGYNVVTEVKPATRFWKAEEDHQDYLEKNPGGYNCHAPIDRFATPAMNK